MTGSGMPPTKLTPWLWLGRQKDAQNSAWMEKEHITHVVNCLDEECGPHPEVLRTLRQYVALESHDTIAYPLFHKRSKSRGGKSNWEITEAILKDAHMRYSRGNHDSAALIYCKAGLNRSATLATAYLALHSSKDIERIATSIRAKRPGALSNPGFVKQLAQVLHKECAR